MSTVMENGPKAPKDPTKKLPGFYIMHNKGVCGSPQPDGRGITFIYEDSGRMLNAARMVGNIENEEIIKLLETTEGFRKLVDSIGVSIESDNRDEIVDFEFQMYGHKSVYGSGTTLKMSVRADGMENVLKLDEQEWSDDDNIPGQIRFVFQKGGSFANVSVIFYVRPGFEVPPVTEELPVDFNSDNYKKIIDKTLMYKGNNYRLKKAIDKARKGEDVTVAYIGGSITQGAGAVPINEMCYARKSFEGFCDLCGKGYDENIHYIKAGIGGTPSEFGMLRYYKDVCDYGKVSPDVVVVEFAVNDEGDETKGECFDSLARMIYNGPGNPAVILEFAVFASDFNLQERLSPVGYAYELPMVSTKDGVVDQFRLTYETGRVLTKNQFFYDVFHPTNNGHRIMADGLINLFKKADCDEYDEPFDIANVKPPLGGEFENVRLLEKGQEFDGVSIDIGEFTETDTKLQAVERNMDLTVTPQYPDNWMYKGGSNKPFSMDVTASALLILYKDSSDNEAGQADVYVDGEKVLHINPREVGWIHCNPLIVFRGRKLDKYHVEVKMQPGDEDKEFTIFGFGIVR